MIQNNFWEDKEKISCPCGNPAIVNFMEGNPRPQMLCIFHSYESGALYPLPMVKPDWFTDNTNKELVNKVLTLGSQEAEDAGEFDEPDDGVW